MTMAMEHVDPGRLRSPFRLERKTETTDDLGGQVPQWQAVTTIWGQLESQRADDPERAGDPEQRIRATVLIRADPRVFEDMRLIGADCIWRIRAVHDPDGTGRYRRCVVVTEAPA